MKTATRKPRTKPARTVKVLARPGDLADGRLLVTEGKQTDLYFIRDLPTDIAGRAFEVAKFGMGPDEIYHTLVGADRRDDSCCCKGHTYHGHCRHVEMLAALAARNLI